MNGGYGQGMNGGYGQGMHGKNPFKRKKDKTIRGDLMVKLISATLTRDTDWFGTMDPYVKIKCGTTDHRGPPDIDGGLTPTWNDWLDIVIDGEFTMNLEVYDEDDYKSHDFIGSTIIDLYEISTKAIKKKPKDKGATGKDKDASGKDKGASGKDKDASGKDKEAGGKKKDPDAKKAEGDIPADDSGIAAPVYTVDYPLMYGPKSTGTITLGFTFKKKP